MEDRYAAGTIEVDLQRRQLHVGGQMRAIGARAFDVLATLMERRGEVVTKAELLDAVWPADAVEESNLSVHVHALRRALGAAAIKTVPGRGYRFEAEPGDDPLVPQPDARPGHDGTPAPVLPADPGAAMLGRQAELQQICDLLRHGTRLVSVVGPGGSGKSTLAAALAHRLADGRDEISWIDLSVLEAEALVPATVARSAGRALFAGAEPVTALVQALRAEQRLIVMDGAEHLVDIVARLAAGLLAGCPGVRLLVTTQVPLHIDGEQVMKLGGLHVPPAGTPLQAARQSAAIALFEAGGKRSAGRFELEPGNVEVAIRICRQMDGLPFAIELAAAALSLFSLAELGARLAADDGLASPRGGTSPARQHTVRAALAWSHALLLPIEQVAFRRLGVFVGSFTLEMALAVAAGSDLATDETLEALSVLVERSFAEWMPAVPGGDDRYRLLETSRTYARSLLQASGEEDASSRRQLESLSQALNGAMELFLTIPPGAWLAKFGVELENFRAALRWGTVHDGEAALRLFLHGQEVFTAHGLRTESADLAPMLEGVGQTLEEKDPETAGRLWGMIAHGYRFSNRQESLRFCRKTIDVYRRAGLHRRLCWAISVLLLEFEPSDDERSALLAESRLVEQPGWHAAMCARLMGTGGVATRAHDFDAALRAYDQALEIARNNVPILEYDLHCNLAEMACNFERVELAISYAAKADLLMPEATGSLRASRLVWTLTAHLLAGNTAAAREQAAEFEEALKFDGWYLHVAGVCQLPLLCTLEGRWRHAAELIGHADQLLEAVDLTALRGVEYRMMERARADAVAQLGPQIAESLMAAGRKLHPQQAFDLVLRADTGLNLP